MPWTTRKTFPIGAALVAVVMTSHQRKAGDANTSRTRSASRPHAVD